MDTIGIYMIKNIINNRVYIGKSKHIEQRFKEYSNSLKNNYCHNSKLQDDYDQFGIESFNFKILEGCDYCDLDRLESEYIRQFDAYKNGYNVQDVLNYDILNNKILVCSVKNLLLTAMSKRNSTEQEEFLLTDIASELKISTNDLKVIINDITWTDFEKYDTEIRLERTYTIHRLRRICISKLQKRIDESLKGLKL